MRSPRVSAAVIGGKTLGRWALAVLPLIFLSVLAFRTNRERTPEPANPEFAVSRSSLESMRQKYASHRVRYGIEAYRFSQGEWPRDLAQLKREGLLDDSELAPAEDGPYYYVRTEAGALLLAPEH